jgi:pyruvate/2-oxoacid:ferredoxin oxidoreductase beta subunit
MSMERQEEKDEIPKWANFICPSCGISYGINALIKAIRKRQQEVESSNSLRQN